MTRKLELLEAIQRQVEEIELVEGQDPTEANGILLPVPLAEMVLVDRVVLAAKSGASANELRIALLPQAVG